MDTETGLVRFDFIERILFSHLGICEVRINAYSTKKALHQLPLCGVECVQPLPEWFIVHLLNKNILDSGVRLLAQDVCFGCGEKVRFWGNGDFYAWGRENQSISQICLAMLGKNDETMTIL